MLCQQHVIAGGSYINIGNDTFWPHEISCHIEYKKFLTKTLLNMPGREKENLDNLLHMSQILVMVISLKKDFNNVDDIYYRYISYRVYIRPNLVLVQFSF